jgi:hypothetical protein
MKFNLQFAICNYQFAILLLGFAVNACAAPPMIVPVEGKPFAGELLGFGEKDGCSFALEGKAKSLPLDELVYWGTLREPRRGPVVVFADGGLLAADVLGADKDRLDVDSESFGRLKLPLESLAGVIFRLPGTTAGRDRLVDRLGSAKGDADRFFLENGDELAGTLDTLDEKNVKLQSESGEAVVETGRLVAVAFNPQLQVKPDEKSSRVLLGFSDGSRLFVSSSALKGEGSEANAEPILQFSSFKQNFKTPAKSLVFLQPLSGRAVYLSTLIDHCRANEPRPTNGRPEMGGKTSPQRINIDANINKPAEFRHVPFLSIAWPYAMDRNVQGGMLRAGGRLSMKGIGMHSASRLSFELPPGVKRFQAETALDDSAGADGCVRFRVFVDGQEKYAGASLKSGDPAAAVDLDISGGKRLDLVVDFADRADVQDRADWLDARLVR